MGKKSQNLVFSCFSKCSPFIPPLILYPNAMKITVPLGLKYSPGIWPCNAVRLYYVFDCGLILFCMARKVKKCTFFLSPPLQNAWQPLVEFPKTIFMCYQLFLKPNVMGIIRLCTFSLHCEAWGQLSNVLTEYLCCTKIVSPPLHINL